MILRPLLGRLGQLALVLLATTILTFVLAGGLGDPASQLAGIDSSPVVVGERVFFGSRDKNLYGLSLADGTQVWKYSAGQAISGSPAIGEGHLVIGTDETNGRILCFGAK